MFTCTAVNPFFFNNCTHLINKGRLNNQSILSKGRSNRFLPKILHLETINVTDVQKIVIKVIHIQLQSTCKRLSAYDIYIFSISLYGKPAVYHMHSCLLDTNFIIFTLIKIFSFNLPKVITETASAVTTLKLTAYLRLYVCVLSLKVENFENMMLLIIRASVIQCDDVSLVFLLLAH